jgi:hypothetical protein
LNPQWLQTETSHPFLEDWLARATFRNVEDIIPDNDIVSSQSSKSIEIVGGEPKESVPRPLTK